MGAMTRDGSALMQAWAETAERVRGTRRTSEKVAIVAGYLGELDDADLAIAATFLGGRPFPEREQRTVGLGWAAIVAVVQEVTGAGEGAMRAAYDRSSDLGIAVGELFAARGAGSPSEGPPLSLRDVAATYEALASARGVEPKRTILATLLARADPLSARSIVSILGGELRIGLREGHLEAAIGQAFERDAGRRPVGGHAHGGHRAYGPPGAPRRARGGAAGALPPAQVDARLARR